MECTSPSVGGGEIELKEEVQRKTNTGRLETGLEKQVIKKKRKRVEGNQAKRAEIRVRRRD